MSRFLNIVIAVIFVGACYTFDFTASADAYKYHPKEKEFTKAFIKSLPEGFEHKNEYIEDCRAKNYSCLPTETVIYAESICKALDNGRPVKDVFENMMSFFGNEEGIAIVTASVDVICPRHLNKLRK